MIYILLISFIILAISWKKSKNSFFDQSREVLLEKRQLLELVLKDRNIPKETRKRVLEIYGILKNYPNIYKFDGATIVADIDTIKGLDVPAMVHDYDYQVAQYRGFWYYVKAKLKADVDYGKLMRLLGVSWLTAWTRVTGLIISTPIWLVLLTINGKFKRTNI
jgi:uncharacterized protein (UPF0147 family)